MGINEAAYGKLKTPLKVNDNLNQFKNKLEANLLEVF